ncbi:hypothetical protein CHU98_g6308 [Xylaria longipes]|nr:hypothetical protein CHU98_g6308 [Xylaria longipes]
MAAPGPFKASGQQGSSKPFRVLTRGFRVPSFDDPTEANTEPSPKEAFSALNRSVQQLNQAMNQVATAAYSDLDQAIVLLILRDSLTPIPKANISYLHNPVLVLQTLKQLYKPNDDKARDTLYKKFHSLAYSRTLGSDLNHCLHGLKSFKFKGKGKGKSNAKESPKSPSKSPEKSKPPSRQATFQSTYPVEPALNSVNLVESKSTKATRNNPWLYDMSSTAHIANKKHWFVNYTEFTGDVSPGLKLLKSDESHLATLKFKELGFYLQLKEITLSSTAYPTIAHDLDTPESTPTALVLGDNLQGNSFPHGANSPELTPLQRLDQGPVRSVIVPSKLKTSAML